MKLRRYDSKAIYLLAAENALTYGSLLKDPQDVAELSASSLDRGLNSSVRGLWNGALDMTSFMHSMFELIEIEYTNAWEAGMAAAGVDSKEMSEDERSVLYQHIVEAQGRVYDFGSFVEEHGKAEGGKLGETAARTDLWLTGWNTVYNEALSMASNDPMLKWVLGATEKHCDSCQRLNGKVKRASVWDAAMLQPANPPNSYLTCGGWRCECYFEVTTSQQSAGRLPGVGRMGPIGPAPALKPLPTPVVEAAPETKVSPPVTTPVESVELVREEIRRLAKESGVDVSKIIFEEKSKGRTAGEYYYKSTNIHIYPRALTSLNKGTGVFIHELAHLRLDEKGHYILNYVWGQMGREMVLADFNKAGFISAYHDEIVYGFGIRNKKISANLVLNEAFAELSRLDYQGKLGSAPAVWVDFYHRVKDVMR